MVLHQKKNSAISHSRTLNNCQESSTCRNMKWRDFLTLNVYSMSTLIELQFFIHISKQSKWNVLQWNLEKKTPGNKNRWPTKTTLGQNNSFITHVEWPGNEDHLSTKTTHFWSKGWSLFPGFTVVENVWS